MRSILYFYWPLPSIISKDKDMVTLASSHGIDLYRLKGLSHCPTRGLCGQELNLFSILKSVLQQFGKYCLLGWILDWQATTAAQVMNTISACARSCSSFPSTSSQRHLKTDDGAAGWGGLLPIDWYMTGKKEELRKMRYLIGWETWLLTVGSKRERERG